MIRANSSPPPRGPTTASDLYAISQGSRNEGPEACFWCGSECNRMWRHFEPTLDVGQKRRAIARRPASNYVCMGCWLWNRKRITVTHLDEKFTDGQCPAKHSWWVDEKETFSLVRPYSYGNPISPSALINPPTSPFLPVGQLLYPKLLKPPLVFFLSFKEDKDEENLLQLIVLNCFDKIEADTKLSYTLNGIIHFYSVYELEEGLKHGGEGKEPGVQTLMRLLGPPIKKKEEWIDRPATPNKVGRPEALKDGKVLKKVIARSGSMREV